MSSALERTLENRTLCTRAHTLMEDQAVLAFRCECRHSLCRDFVALGLGEYDTATAGSRAIVTLGHADVDGRDIVERTSRFCVLQEARDPL
jgi:hypothetical protein